jgi:osmotically-inducible protein OsmY
LTHHGQVDAHDIQVDVQNCEVTLRGTVDSRQTKRIAEDIANSVWGVRDVHNQLRIRQEEEGRQLQSNGSQRERNRR